MENGLGILRASLDADIGVLQTILQPRVRTARDMHRALDAMEESPLQGDARKFKGSHVGDLGLGRRFCLAQVRRRAYSRHTTNFGWRSIRARAARIAWVGNVCTALPVLSLAHLFV